MRPNKWPYQGQKKKQPENQIAKLTTRLNACESNINQLVSQVTHISKNKTRKSNIDKIRSYHQNKMLGY